VERNSNFLLFRIEYYLTRYGHEKSLISLDIILLNVRSNELKVNTNTIGRLESIVVKIFPCFYIVLVVIRPVQIDFLTVVGNGVLLPATIAALGEKIPVII